MSSPDSSRSGNALISSYTMKLVSPACHPGVDRWSAEFTLQADIAAALPYLNAVLEGSDYDHDTPVLIWKSGGYKYAFRPRTISIGGLGDRDEARDAGEKIIARVNEIWKNRGAIEPDYTRSEPPAILTIYKLLPRENCKECGYETCMAFAADLQAGTAALDRCTRLTGEGKKQIRALFPAARAAEQRS